MLRNKWLKRLFYVIACLLGLLLTAAGGLAFYLYGTPQTRLGDGDFHPSWTAEERMALQQAEHYLLFEMRDEDRKLLRSSFWLFSEEEFSPFSFHCLELELALRKNSGNWKNRLTKAAVSGNAHRPSDTDDEGWYSLVLALANCGEPNITKTMVRHGTMLNLKGDLENSADLKYVNSSLLMHVLKSGTYKKEELFELADWLVQQPGEGLPRTPNSELYTVSEDNAAFIQRLREQMETLYRRYGISPTQS